MLVNTLTLFGSRELSPIPQGELPTVSYSLWDTWNGLYTHTCITPSPSHHPHCTHMPHSSTLTHITPSSLYTCFTPSHTSHHPHCTHASPPHTLPCTITHHYTTLTPSPSHTVTLSHCHTVTLSHWLSQTILVPGPQIYNLTYLPVDCMAPHYTYVCTYYVSMSTGHRYQQQCVALVLLDSWNLNAG